MSDEALRALEQRWLATRTRDDEVRYLAARLRAGDLSRGRLELAAWLRHAPARTLLGDAAPVGEFVDHAALGRALDAGGQVAVLRAALVEWAERPGSLTPRAADGLEALRRWCEDPADLGPLQECVAELDPIVEELMTLHEFETAALVRDLHTHAAAVVTAAEEPAQWVPLLSRFSARRAATLAWALGPDHALDPDPRDEDVVEGRHLAWRLETGALSRERLEQAAYAGHRPAQLALGAAAPLAPTAFIPWLEGTARWGRDALLRSVIDVCSPFWFFFGPAALEGAMSAFQLQTHADAELDRLLLDAREAVRVQLLAEDWFGREGFVITARLLDALLDRDAAAALAVARRLERPDAAVPVLETARDRLVHRALTGRIGRTAAALQRLTRPGTVQPAPA